MESSKFPQSPVFAQGQAPAPTESEQHIADLPAEYVWRDVAVSEAPSPEEFVCGRGRLGLQNP